MKELFAMMKYNSYMKYSMIFVVFILFLSGTFSVCTPMTWTISSGRLSAGLNLNATTGVISGAPTAVGTSNFSARVANSVENTTRALNIVINL
jgi:hypothetical protein